MGLICLLGFVLFNSFSIPPPSYANTIIFHFVDFIMHSNIWIVKSHTSPFYFLKKILAVLILFSKYNFGKTDIFMTLSLLIMGYLSICSDSVVLYIGTISFMLNVLIIISLCNFYIV